MSRIFAFFLALLWLMAGDQQLRAAPEARTGHADVALLADTSVVAAGEVVWLAVSITPDDGWHTYWRNPGDSGLPTTIAWTMSEGFAAGDIRWPIPHAVPYGPLMNFGYKDKHLLLVPVNVPDDLGNRQRVMFAARVDFLICEEICIPEGTDISLSLPVGDRSVKGVDSEQFIETQKAWPVPAPWAAAYTAEGNGWTLRLAADRLDAPLRFFPYAEGVIDAPAVQKIAVKDGYTYLGLARGEASPEGPQAGVLVAGQGEAATGYVLTAEPAAFEWPAWPETKQSGQNAADTMSAWMAILYAFIGGILLNLMPCVFPVLSLKALAVVRAAGETRTHMQREGLAYTTGILVSFLMVAGALLALRAGGEAIGWGFQLQSPTFIAILAMVLFVVGLSLSGLLVLGGRFAGVGQALTEKEGSAGAFFTGVLATVVATPCTAPFMAPALGYALVQPPVMALLIFVGLGLGLAFPFLLITYVPALANRLPKPGPWMESFKQFLAFPVYATAIWLVWVLAQQAGANGVALLLAAMLMVVLAVWCAGRSARLAKMVAILAIGLAAALVAFAGQQKGTVSASVGKQTWSKERVASLRAEGKPVFVNFTAAWCVTCIANEQVALSTTEVQQYFADHAIVYLEAGWTQRDAPIAIELAAYGRSGVPLYLYFPVGGEAVILPQLLTPGLIIDRLEAAEGGV